MDENPSGVRISPSPHEYNMILKSIKYYLIYLVSFFSLAYSGEKIAFFSIVSGECLIENVEENRNNSAGIGTSILNFDIISSDSKSSCDIIFNDKATKIHLDSNTKIKFINDKFSRIIKLYSGNLYIENANSEFKTYVQTQNNDIYINNNKVWVNTNVDFDRLFSIKTFTDVYSLSSEKNISTTPILFYEISSDGNVMINDNLDYLPEYVMNESYNHQSKFSYEDYQLFLNSYDLIPIYHDRKRKPIFNNNKIIYRFSSGLRYMNDNEFLSFSFNPLFKYYNLKISGNFDFYVNSDKELLNNWEDVWDFFEKINLNFIYKRDYNRLNIKLGHISKVNFGHGYLVNNLSNNFDYPHQQNFGLKIDYKLDENFMNFKFIIPNIKDFTINNSGIFGMHSSLFISHRFPLTLGFGIMLDLNQFSQADDIYNFNNQSVDKIKRKVTAAEFDFNVNIVKKINLDISLYGEFVGIWYPDYIYYIRSEGVMPYDDDKRYREGTWGIMAPGLSVKLNNRLEMKFALNFNSAAHIPNYFNSNYLYNKSIYYNQGTAITFNSLGFNLLMEQITMLNQFSINQNNTEFMFPKEIYPIVIPPVFNAFPVYGLTSEIKYNYNNKVDIAALSSLYVQQTDYAAAGSYYSIQSIISIKDNVIRNISFMDFYLSNIFFWGENDLEGLIFGYKFGVKLPVGMSLIFDLGQVYYDANLSNDKKEMINAGVDFGISF